MHDLALRDCRLLLVEDEYLLAYEMQTVLENAGAIVIGPVGTLADATTLIEDAPHIDGAVLDTNLAGEMVFPAAELLIERGVPIVFTTGYDTSIFPAQFQTAARCEKPVNMKSIIEVIARAVENRS